MYVVGVLNGDDLGDTLLAETLEEGYEKMAQLIEENGDNQPRMDYWIDHCTMVTLSGNVYFFGYLQD